MPWPTKKLGEVINIIESGRRPRGGAVSSGIPSLGVEHMNDDGGFKLDKVKYIPEDFYGQLQKGIIKRFDVLIAKDGATTGKVSLIGDDFPFKKVAVNEHVFIVRGQPKLILQKFIFYFLFGSTGNKQILRTKHGAAQGGIGQSFVNFVKIPLPPLKIQKQIVARLDKIVEAQKLNDGLIQKADEFFQSLLCQELNPAGKNWEVKKLGSVFDRITDAILPTKHPEQKFNFIGLENIESNTSRLVDISPVQGRFIKSTKTRFKIGDVLYGKLRPYLNKVWLADFDGICSTDIWVLRTKEGIILPQLLGAILQQSSIVQKSSASMAGANLPRANKDVFDKVAISLPPLNTQKQIVEKLSAAQDYKSQLLAQRSKLKELFDSVLYKSMAQNRS